MEIDGKFWACADYSHIRIPKRLLSAPEYKMIQPETKVVYGAMLDRTNLSRKNHKKFTNERNETFIYFPQSEVMRLVGCSHDKATKIIKDLVKSGLIKVKRHGIGRPYEIVLTPIDWRTRREIRNEQSEKPQQDSQKSDDLLCEKTDGNNTEHNNADSNNPEIYLRRYLKTAIEYDALIATCAPTLVNRILDVTINTIVQETEEFLIGNESFPAEIVKEALRNLRKDNVIYAVKKIRNAAYTTDHSDAFVLNALCEAIKNQ